MLAEGSAQDRCINERFPYLYQSSPQRKEWPEQAGHQGVHRFTPPARSGFAISHICAVTFLTELLPPQPYILLLSKKHTAYYVPFPALFLCLFVTIHWKGFNLQRKNTFKSKLKNLNVRKMHSVPLRANSKLTCP